MLIPLIGIGILFFVIGIGFVLKSYLSTPNENTMVPLVELQKAKTELAQSKEAEARWKSQFDQVTRDAQTFKKNFEEIKVREDKLTKTLEEFQSSSKEGMYKATVEQLETELAMIKSKAESQAKDALEIVDTLNKENENFKNQIEAANQRIKELEPQIVSKGTIEENIRSLEKEKKETETMLETLKKEHQILLDEFNQKLSEFEQIKNTFQTEKSGDEERFSRTTAMIDVLNNEKNALIKEKDRYIAIVDQMKEDIDMIKKEGARHLTQAMDHLRLENDHLRQQLQELTEKLQLWEIQMTSLQKESQDSWFSSNQIIKDLRNENQSFQTQLQESLTKIQELQIELEIIRKKSEEELTHALDTVERLRKDKDSVFNARDELEINLQKTKAVNLTLLEKEDLVQYEIVKNRAQALGLEKLCEELKFGIEARTKEITNLKEENGLLLQMKLETEQNLQNLKKSHAQLIKKDKLSQAELEKSRNQLAIIEKAYSVFRNKFEDIDSINNEPQNESGPT